MERSEDDPKGLIREAYRMDGLGSSECRSIFLDWALSVDATPERIGRLVERYGAEDHPMTAVLREASAAPTATGRRGGRRARLGAAGFARDA